MKHITPWQERFTGGMAASFEVLAAAMQAEIDELRAALAQPASAPAAVSGWLPIESAPKDGTEILLGYPDGSLAVAYWNGTCFIEGDFNCDWATHWKPKPAAPTGEPS